MEEYLNSNLAKELLTFLPYFEEDFINNISSDLLEKLVILAADSDKDFFIQKNKKLSEQNISEECKDFIALLYYQNSEDKIKNELLENWLNNDIRVN